MKVKYFIPVVLLIIVLFSGCGNFKRENYTGEEKTIQITGVPRGISAYDLKLYIRKDAEVLKVYQYTNRNASQIYNEIIAVADDATSITAYVYVDSKPEYFAYTDCTSSQTNYSLVYWMDYDEYFTYKILNFGISETIAHNVDSYLDMELNFNYAPYYLIKLPNVLGRYISISASVKSGGSIEINYGSNINNLTGTIYSGSYNFNNYANDCLYVLIQPDSYNTALPVVTLQIYSFKPISIYGYISDMVAGDTPDVVYAINRNSNLLYYINPLAQEITQTFSLPNILPKAMAYSATDKKLYIVGDNSNLVTIWDLVTTKYSQISFSESQNEYGLDIAVGPNSSTRRIYMLSNVNLYIINMDSPFQVLNSIYSSSKYRLDFDEIHAKVFSRDDYTLTRYLVLNDQITSEQNLSIEGYSVRNLVLSPDKTKLILSGNGSNGYAVYAYDTTNFSNALGHWNIGTNPHFVSLSPDGSILYGNNGNYNDKFIYVMDGQNYSLIRKLPFPNSNSSNAIFTSNSDGSVLVAFSGYYSDSGSIYYYQNIQKEAALQLNSINVKANIAKLTSEKDLSPSNL